MPDAPHAGFTGSKPAIRDRTLIPVRFAPFERDLANRQPAYGGVRVLEPATA